MKELQIEKMAEKICKNARCSSNLLLTATQKKINEALVKSANLLQANKEILFKENKKDINAATRKGLPSAMIDRLLISEKTLASMVSGLREVATLSSSIGTVFDERIRPNGLRVYKIKVPIGVVCIIYESRPNVTVDAAAICLKSKNAVILRGGSESFYSNRALAKLLSEALASSGLPPEAVQLVPTTERLVVRKLLTMSNYIDLVIPRGGEKLIKLVSSQSKIPVIKHYKGVCHIYVSAFADMSIAIPIVVNAKTQRPGVCNAMETLLLDKNLSVSSKTEIIRALEKEGVILFGDPETQKLSPSIKRATESDWYAEYLDLRLAVRIVNGVQEAINHINTYGSHHTDAIISKNEKEIKQFVEQVDSASVMVNTSTRFSDGGEYGMGCEIGISTDKIHARGPMGIEDLTTYKWIVEGCGQIRK